MTCFSMFSKVYLGWLDIMVCLPHWHTPSCHPTCSNQCNTAYVSWQRTLSGNYTTFHEHRQGSSSAFKPRSDSCPCCWPTTVCSCQGSTVDLASPHGENHFVIMVYKTVCTYTVAPSASVCKKKSFYWCFAHQWQFPLCVNLLPWCSESRYIVSGCSVFLVGLDVWASFRHHFWTITNGYFLYTHTLQMDHCHIDYLCTLDTLPWSCKSNLSSECSADC